MSDYRLDRLNTREFEHLVQALCKKFIALGTTPFGDGPDGGREATFDGPMDFPSHTAPWSGYLVVQCKFRQRSIGDAASDTDWVTQQLNEELGKYDLISGCDIAPNPDPYFASNRDPREFLSFRS
ncbi:hypothetical protein, partial [Herbaspirillum sp. C7C2]|uniref:hypothetical protein n=1 Tax=Herbaspirillum sp. C7C2 TaxID=2736666 RepID=UPI00406D1369